jgi:hypothetical protein
MELVDPLLKYFLAFSTGNRENIIYESRMLGAYLTAVELLCHAWKVTERCACSERIQETSCLSGYPHVPTAGRILIKFGINFAVEWVALLFRIRDIRGF